MTWGWRGYRWSRRNHKGFTGQEHGGPAPFVLDHSQDLDQSERKGTDQVALIPRPRPESGGQYTASGHGLPILSRKSELDWPTPNPNLACGEKAGTALQSGACFSSAPAPMWGSRHGENCPQSQAPSGLRALDEDFGLLGKIRGRRLTLQRHHVRVIAVSRVVEPHQQGIVSCRDIPSLVDVPACSESRSACGVVQTGLALLSGFPSWIWRRRLACAVRIGQ